MTINITLIVQVINFLIAYYILERFLIRPFMATKRLYDHQQEALQSMYKTGLEELDSIELQREEEWHKASRKLFNLMPSSAQKPSKKKDVRKEFMRHSLRAAVPQATDHSLVELLKKKLIERITKPKG